MTLSSNILQQKNLKLTSKLMNWNEYRRRLQININLRTKLKCPKDLDIAVNNFIDTIVEAARSATPKIPARLVATSYPREIVMAVKERRRARHRWQITRSPEDKSTFNSASKRATDLIKRINDENFQNFVQSLGANKATGFSLWRVAKAARKPPGYIPPLKTPTGWARNDEEKALIFANHLETTFQPNNIQSDVIPTVDYIEGPKIKITSPAEIKAVIKKLNPKKAPGRDLINVRMLQEFPNKALVMLTYLINAAFRLNYVPTAFKVAKIIMLPKPGKELVNPSSYRPISLLPTLTKLFEKIYIKRLQSIVEDLYIIPNHQFGFRKKHSTIEQIHRVYNTIRNSLEAKQYCPTLYLDVSQAFDRVWTQGLLHKISNYLSDHHVRILESYLENRKFEICYGEATSPVKPIMAGVPQGSVLGPLLYVLYVADILTSSHTEIATFADDTALLSPHNNYTTAVNNLQTAADELLDWTKKWKIQLNKEKSVRVDYSLRKHGYVPTYIDNQPITIAPSARYLGVHLDKRLTWRMHLIKKRYELNLRFRALFWLIRPQSKLSFSRKRLVYITMIRPVWTYAIQLWGSTSNTNYKIVQRFQNKILRKITNAPWYLSNEQLHHDLNILPVKDIARSSACAYEKRLHSHSNVEALMLLEPPPIRRLKKRIPNDVTSIF